MISASPRRLNVFKIVVDAGSFNVAAERLGIAQPSVSAHITALERQAGQPLFHRQRGAKPRLTQAGETLYAYAVDLLRKSGEAEAALTRLRGKSQAEIAIAAQRDIAQYYLPPLLTRFAAAHPGTRFVTRTGTLEDVIAQVRERAVDVGFVATMGPDRQMPTRLLRREPLLFVVSHHHPLARKDSVEPKDLANYPFVTGLKTSRFFRMMDGLLRKMGLPDYAIAMESQDFASVRELARHGAGIAGMLAFSVADELKAGTLVALKLKTPDGKPAPTPTMQVRCAYATPAPRIVQDFVNSLSETSA
jgi:DNA-binding transcriptional LysR family regulator